MSFCGHLVYFQDYLQSLPPPPTSQAHSVAGGDRKIPQHTHWSLGAQVALESPWWAMVVWGGAYSLRRDGQWVGRLEAVVTATVGIILKRLPWAQSASSEIREQGHPPGGLLRGATRSNKPKSPQERSHPKTEIKCRVLSIKHGLRSSKLSRYHCHVLRAWLRNI